MKQRFLLILFVFCAFQLTAQPDIDSVNLSSPYHTIQTHLWFLQANEHYDAEKASQVFSNKVANKEKKAIQLKQILDGKGLRVAMSQLPRDNDYRDSLAKEHIYVIYPGTLPEIYLEKKGEEWFYSDETVRAIARLHRSVYPFGTDWLVNLMPYSDRYQLFGLHVWQYIGIGILLLLVFLVHQLTTFLFRMFIRRMLKTRFNNLILDKELILKISKLVSYILMIWILIRLFPILQFSIDAGLSVMTVLKVMRTVFIVLLGFKIVDLMELVSKRITEKTENTLDDQIVPILKQTFNIVIATIGIIFALNLLDVNITALIAGISIGGLALALAAQETVKNLIGSMMIFIDRPFQIGDYISTNDASGTVEEVGFRSTRIRTAQNSLMTIPNGALANKAIDNLGLRIYRRYQTALNLTYDTAPETIEKFVQGVRDIIEKHPKTRKEAQAVYFSGMSASSLDISVSIYFEVPGYAEEMTAKQEILLEILALAKKEGVDFAFPSTSVYIEKKG